MTTQVGASILFTDLVGSTALASTLGAAEAERIRTQHFGLLRDVVAAHRGREVKNLGDGIMAVFPGVGAALDAGVAMQQGFDRQASEANGPLLRIRIGVAAGDCVEEDGDYFGEPVVQAARLCAAADGGQILATEVVRLLSPRGAHDFTTLGDRDLKGLPEPVPVVEVIWHPEVGEPPPRVPLSARLTAPSTFGFAGREAEREVLRVALKEAGAGSCRVVLVSGEAGLGKTQLATEFAREAFDADALVLYGRCDEELVVPYRPWSELLRHWVGHTDDEDMARLGERRLAELSTLVPEILERVPASEAVRATGPITEQYVLFSAVTALVATLAAERPVVIVLDDLHWADRASLQLMRHVVGELRSTALLLVGTYRETDLGVGHRLTETLAALRRDIGVERVALAGLSDTEVISMLEAAAGHDMDSDGVQLAQALRAETTGNPFFVGEMLLHLAESGVIAQQADGRWAATVDLADVGLPQSVREVIGERVQRLGEEARRVLSAAAIVGRDFDVGVVAAVVDRDDNAVVDVLEVAMTAGLVAEVTGTGDQFTFTHALVQHTLYSDLPASRRVRLHRRVAEAIEHLADDDPGRRAGELANHWLAATGPDELDKVVGYSIQAGERALEALAPDDAVGWFRQALNVLDTTRGTDDHRRCAILVRLGDAERQAGDPVYRERLLEGAALAREIGADDLLIAAALANHRGLMSAVGQVDTERVAILDAALDAVGPADCSERARLMATLASELAFSDEPRGVEMAMESVAVARRCGDPDALIDSLLGGTQTIAIPDLFEAYYARAMEALELTAGHVDPVRRFWAVDEAATAHLRRGEAIEARRCNDECNAIARRLGQPILRWTAAWEEAVHVMVDGNISEAERLAEEAFELGVATGQPDALVFYGSQLIGIRWAQGRLVEVVPLIAATAEENPGLGVYRIVLAWACAHAGDHARARPLFGELRSEGFAVQRNMTWLASQVYAADTAALLDDRDAAALLYDRLLPYEDLIASSGILVEGAVSHYLGCLAAVLDRPGDAERHLVDALERHERLEAPFHTARTLLALASILEGDDPDRATQARQRAVDLAEEHGFEGLRVQATAPTGGDAPGRGKRG